MRDAMAMTIEKVLSDARLLVTRLKDQDNSADGLITQAQGMEKRVEAMTQFEEELNLLNEVARHKPRSQLALSIAAENSQIRELQQENRDLRMSLEEHQSALELIMSKYRQQVMKLVLNNRLTQSSISSGTDESGRSEVEEKIDKICEMATVMQHAVAIDDTAVAQEKEELVRLQVENQTLRELLQISVSSTSYRMHLNDESTQCPEPEEGLAGCTSEGEGGDNTQDDISNLCTSGELCDSKTDLSGSFCSETTSESTESPNASIIFSGSIS